jgi:hypothetical protein
MNNETEGKWKGSKKERGERMNNRKEREGEMGG